MNAKEIYEAEKTKFNTDYGIEFSIEDYQTSRDKIRALNNFIFESNTKTTAFDSYVDTLSAALSVYLDKLTKMEAQKVYDTTDVSIGNFIMDFDKLMDKKFLSELPEGDLHRHLRFEGENFSDVAKAVWNRVLSMNKPLPEIWANNIVSENFSVDQMKEITATAITNLSNVRNESGLSVNNKKDLTNVVLAQKAMEKLREKRSTWWKLRHLIQNSREKKYLKALTNQVNSYRQMRLPVDKIISEYSQRALSNAWIALEADMKTNGPKTNQKTGEKTANTTLTNSKQANQLFANTELTANIKGQIGEMIGKVSANEFLNDMTRDTLYNNAIKDIKTMWTLFENDKGFDKEANLKNSTNGLFLNVQLKLSMLSLKPKDKMVMAQRITDLMLKQYSPVASDPKYEKYGDNYYLKNTDTETIKRVMKIKDNADEAIAEAKLDLGIGEKIPIDISKDVTEIANSNDKSAVVNIIESPNLQQQNTL